MQIAGSSVGVHHSHLPMSVTELGQGFRGGRVPPLFLHPGGVAGGGVRMVEVQGDGLQAEGGCVEELWVAVPHLHKGQMSLRWR